MNFIQISKQRPLATIACIAMLTGCAGTSALSHEPVNPDKSARVQLDYNASLITFPVEQYQISNSDWSVVSEAREIILNQCMTKGGFAPDPERAASISEDRNFGIWNVERTRLYGFSIPGVDTTSDNVAPKPPGWGDARDKCVQQEAGRLAEVSPADPTVNPSIADKIQHQSLALASKDPAWRDVREEWWTCLRGRGLEPRTGEQEWSSKQALDLAVRSSKDASAPPSNEESIRVATLEAECNQSARMTQRLGDIQASYQLPLIAKNQAALNEVKSEEAKLVATARQFVLSNQ
ncbi:MAG: hypothetical protein J0I04_16430 [Paenarthrobacter ureafaciens]|uniref:hypothetical protein n=1 Tax=Paenarthrobacter ureafaciens TaxID=37931 RepID=UPI001ACAA5DE|nr:hypothetical protein [Paenarthrobacter ureafaciens]MBN9131218.1 hypothetical protein [Paenarthrobacter ureafaciens]